MTTENKKQSFYRVERWWNHSTDNSEDCWNFYRSHTFNTMDEVKDYIQKYNDIYRLKVFKVEEELLEQLEPTYEGCMTEEEAQKFLENPALLSEDIEQIRKEWTE